MSIRSSSSKHHRTQSNFTDYEPNRRRGSSDSTHRSDRHSSSDRSSGSKRRRDDDRYHGHSKRRRHSKDRDSRSKSGSRSDRHRSKSPPAEPVEQDEEYRQRIEKQLQLAVTDAETEEEKRARKRRERMAAIKAKHAQKKAKESETKPEEKNNNIKSEEATKTQPEPTPMDTDEPKPSKRLQKEEEDEPKPEPEKKAASPKKPAFDLFSDQPADDLFASQLSDKTRRKGPDPAADKEGYYKARIGDIIGGKYKIVGFHGKGQFGNVLKANNILEKNKEVAIKLLRSNDVMKRSGFSEIKFLEEIKKKDPHNTRNCVYLYEQLQERGHLCLVFENLEKDLRQFRKGWKGALPLPYVRAYTFRLLNALTLLDTLGIIHADLKPDNILVTKKGDNIKLADFGSAMNESQVQVTPLLVSRYYRAPEIILGMKYGMAIDMFALGCTVYELAMGRPMLRSRDNNHHLSLLLEYKGVPTKKFLAKGCFSRDHFDTQGRFLEHTSDPADPTRVRIVESK